MRLDDEKPHAIQPSEPHWSVWKPFRPAIRPGHLVNKRKSGQIWPRAGFHMENVGYIAVAALLNAVPVQAQQGSPELITTPSGQTLEIPPPLPPQKFPLYCHGPLHWSGGDGAMFRWSPYGAIVKAPAPGHCAWEATSHLAPGERAGSKGFLHFGDGWSNDKEPTCAQGYVEMAANKYAVFYVSYDKVKRVYEADPIIGGFVKPPFKRNATPPRHLCDGS